jgi:Tfp pilus assembly protein PilV
MPEESLMDELLKVLAEKRDKEYFLRVLDIRLEQYKHEQDKILKSVAEFEVFLKLNAIAPFQDPFVACIDEKIAKNIKDCDSSNESKQQLVDLKNILRQYNVEKDKLAQLIQTGNQHVAKFSATHVKSLILNLCSLQKTGKQIERSHSECKINRANERKHEVTYHVKNKQSRSIMTFVKKTLGLAKK